MGSFLKYLFQIILSPAKGWEDVAYDLDERIINVRHLYLHAFLPLIGICSVSAFVRLLYGANDMLGCTASAIIGFVSMFLTYHLAIYSMSSFMPRFVDKAAAKKQDQRKLALVVMMSVGFIALVILLANVIKVQLAIIQFLPFHVIFILWKGCGFLGVEPRQEGLYMILASASVLGAYYLLNFMFNALV